VSSVRGSSTTSSRRRRAARREVCAAGGGHVARGLSVLHMVVLRRWIPTTSVDEYSATPARWFGVAAHDLPIVLPNIGRFAMPHLGFLE